MGSIKRQLKRLVRKGEMAEGVAAEVAGRVRAENNLEVRGGRRLPLAAAAARRGAAAPDGCGRAARGRRAQGIPLRSSGRSRAWPRHVRRWEPGGRTVTSLR